MRKNTLRKRITKPYTKLAIALGVLLSSVTATNAQVVLEDEVKISDIALHFGGSKVASNAPETAETAPYDFFFGASISAHGDCVKTYNQYVFMTWYRGGKGDRHVMLSRYNTETGTVATIEFPHRHTGYLNRWWIGESHNTIGLGVSPVDGTIHMVYDMHAYSRTRPSDGSLSNDYFRYSFSEENAASLSDEEFTLDKFVQNSEGGYKHLSLNGGEDYSNFNGLTYPQFFLNDSGDLFLYIREGGNNNGAYKFSKYDASSSTWSNFTNFNILNARSRGEQYNWGLYGNMKYVDGKIQIGFQRRSSNNNDKFQYQNGLYYAYSDNQDGTDSWKDHTGQGFSLPLIDADEIKVFEPGDLVETTAANQVYIVQGFDWTVTNQGDVHMISMVTDNENGGTKSVHTYKPAGASDFITTTEFAGATDIYTSGDNIYIIGLNDNDRVFVEKAKGGTNNFRRVYEATSGNRYDHGAIYISDGKLYYYLMQKSTGSAQPIYLQTIDLDLDAPAEPLQAAMVTPGDNETVNHEATIELKAEAYTDNGTVTRVDFRLDGEVLEMDDSAPFTMDWNASDLGEHTLDVVAYSSTGEVVTSEGITITVAERDPTDLTGDVYLLRNVATGMYLDSENSEVIASSSVEGTDKQWEFVKVGSGDHYNIESKSARGILRYAGGSAGTMVNTGFSAPREDTDKMWTVIYNEADETYTFKTRNITRYLYHNSDNTIIHSTATDDRSKWVAELASAVLSTEDETFVPQTVTVFPNPAKDGFTIKMNAFGKAAITISDILGKTVYTNTVQANSIQIETTNRFKSGIYLIKVVGDSQKVYHTKLVIE